MQEAVIEPTRIQQTITTTLLLAIASPDQSYAAWLHKALETFSLPKTL